MIYQGRELDAIALWESLVDFPARMPDSGFAPLVRCPNPEHQTDKRHFQINLDKPLVHCFASCGISGTYEHALSIALGVSLRDAKRQILRHCGVSLGKSSQRKVRGTDGRVRKVGGRTEKTEPIDLSFSTYIPAYPMGYLDSRGISAESIASFGIGWDADERRIVIPAHDERNVLRFLIKRAIREKDWPKYLYTEGYPKTSLLFGACHLDREAVQSQGLVLTEGSLDVVRLHQHGCRNAVAILGTGISEKQAAIISRIRPRRVVMLFDKDGAGWRNIQSCERMLRAVPLFTCLYPKGKSDPAELTRKEVERAVDKAISLVEFKARLPKRLRTKEKTYA